MRQLLLAATAAASLVSGVAVAQNNVPLIPREVLFGNPVKANARISPDGKWLSWTAPVDGVLNIWVAPASNLASSSPRPTACSQRRSPASSTTLANASLNSLSPAT